MSNSENNNETPPEGNSQTTPDVETLLAEKKAIEERYSASSTEAKRLAEANKKAFERDVKLLEKDGSIFIDIHDADPDHASSLAKHFWYSSSDELLATLSGSNDTPAKRVEPTLNKEELFKEWEEMQARKEWMKRVEKLFESLSPEEKEKAKAEYDELVDERSLPPEKLEKYAKNAILSVKWGQDDSIFAMIWSNAVSKQAPAGSKKEDKNSWAELAKALWLWHLYSK